MKGKDTDTVQELFQVHELESQHPLTIMQTIMEEQDTLYLHEARKQPDWLHFRKAMDDEMQQHIKHNNFVIIDKKDKNENIDVLPAVWALRSKRKMMDGSVIKYKA